ncbi:hypothetical protein ACFZAM_10370 [Streptomyces sp. NPDC008079]|uniref:hypothetical protein n=1 Tax=Streptomyces sp. NPDC008079 TaxID=3364806 RepID=UPI0036E10328
MSQVSEAGEGARQARTHRFEPVTLGEIKELAGVGRPTVSNWRRRHVSFPAAMGGTESKPLFDAEEVAEWLDARPVPEAEREDDGRTPTYGDRFRAALRLRRLVALKHDGVPAETLIRSALAVIADSAAGDRPDPTAGREPGGREQAGQLEQAVAELLAGTPTPGAAADAVLGLAGRLESDLAMDATPAVVADLVAALVRRTAAGSSVISLDAGTGDLLFALDHARHGRITAVEPDGLRRELLGHRLRAHGVRSIGLHTDVPTLRAEGCAAADVVVADPPYAAAERETADDGPLNRAVEAVRLLAPGGTAYVVVPSWTLVRRRTGVRSPNVHLREYLLLEDAVAGIVQLPRRIHPFRTGAELALLVLRRDAEPGRRGRVRLVDGDRIALRTGLGERWTQGVAEALGAADAPASEEARDLPVAAAGPRDEHLLDGGSLLPAHRLASPERGLDHFGASLDARREAAAALPDLREWIGGLGIAKREGPVLHRRLDEHVRAGQLKLLPGHRIRAEDVTDTGLVVIGREEMLGTLPIGRRRIALETLGGYPQAAVTERGDVLLLTEHGVRTHVDDAGGCVLLAPVQGLRITAYAQHQEQRAAGGPVRPGSLWIGPHPLARLLAAPRNQQRGSGSLVRRVSVRDMDLPQLPPEEITELEAVLVETDRHRAEVRRQLDALDALAERLAAGVADGALALRRRPSR